MREIDCEYLLKYGDRLMEMLLNEFNLAKTQSEKN